MSRIGSSSGVRVAATQLSNVYTVLLLVTALALVISVVLTGLTLQKRYSSILPVGEAGERTESDLRNTQAALKANADKLQQGQDALGQFMGGAPAAVPEKPAVETPATPPAEKPAEKPAETPAEKPAAETPPAPAAGEKPATKPAAPAAGEKPADAPATPAAGEKPAEKPATPATPAPADK